MVLYPAIGFKNVKFLLSTETKIGSYLWNSSMSTSYKPFNQGVVETSECQIAGVSSHLQNRWHELFYVYLLKFA